LIHLSTVKNYQCAKKQACVRDLNLENVSIIEEYLISECRTLLLILDYYKVLDKSTLIGSYSSVFEDNYIIQEHY